MNYQRLLATLLTQQPGWLMMRVSNDLEIGKLNKRKHNDHWWQEAIVLMISMKRNYFHSNQFSWSLLRSDHRTRSRYHVSHMSQVGATLVSESQDTMVIKYIWCCKNTAACCDHNVIIISWHSAQHSPGLWTIGDLVPGAPCPAPDTTHSQSQSTTAG